MEYKLLVNGFENIVSLLENELQQTHLKLLNYLSRLQRSKARRILCFLSAPPGAGKSTLAALWEKLSQEYNELIELQALSLDGFHYNNDYLSRHTLYQNGSLTRLSAIKGAPETYDVDKLTQFLAKMSSSQNLTWPCYDRNLHEPLADAIQVKSPLVLIEGNWLLYTEHPWKNLANYADCKIYQNIEEHLLKSRLIERKMRGGITLQKAEEHYMKVDHKNIGLVQKQRLAADFELCWNKEKVCWYLKGAGQEESVW